MLRDLRTGRRGQIAGLAAGLLAVVLSLPAPAQEARGTLIHAQGTVCADTLNQHLSNNTPCRMVARHVLDNLVAVNPADGTVHPWLAESWEITAGGRIYTFRLRRGVRFHDGTPFNAEAVRFNFEWTMSPDRPRRGFRYLAMGGPRYIRTEVVDEFTVRVVFREPHGGFLTYLSDGGLGIDSPAALRRLGDDYGSRELVGTGPFRLVSWTRGAEAVLERNPDYRWGARVFGHTGPAFVERLVYRQVPEAATRAAVVETGQATSSQITPPDIAVLRGKPGVRIVLVPKAGTARMMLLNTKESPTNDIRVRRAINHAINKPLLMRLPAWSGTGRPGLGPLPTNMVPRAFQGLYRSQLQPVDLEYNPDRARQLLEEAGWRVGPDGIRVRGSERLVLDHVIPEGTAVRESEPLQAMLRQVGIELRFRIGDFNFWIGTVSKGEYRSTIMSDSGYESAGILSSFFRTGSVYNWYGFSSPELDRMLDTAVASADPETRWRNLIGAMRIILANAVGVMGWEEDYVFAARANVENLQFNEVAFPYFYATRLR
ncbi:MAG: ABC transporter substrate-binding protein [Armatimonadota bacterium]|nr:ABC transporter substrate-binding protein [Armatimonadota bacterium]MDR5696604.1 ABC transporter substrate-binding protein [Armatimonadota bacterium]